MTRDATPSPPPTGARPHLARLAAWYANDPYASGRRRPARATPSLLAGPAALLLVLGLVLSAALVAALLAGCGGSGPEPEPTCPAGRHVDCALVLGPPFLACACQPDEQKSVVDGGGAEP